MSEERDRLGQKLHDKGRGDEERFIEQQERERLARLKAKLASSTVGTGACPRDGERLVSRSDHRVTIDCCPACKGIWLDNGELEIILRNEDEASVTRWLRALLER